MTTLLPGPVGLWTGALDALLGEDPSDVPRQDWARLAPVAAFLR